MSIFANHEYIIQTLNLPHALYANYNYESFDLYSKVSTANIYM